jgi:hypothetical protein
MANNLQIDEGTSGKYAETTDLGAGVHRPSVLVANTSISGAAGTPNAGVISVQGIASMTALQVGGSAAHDAAAAGNPVLAGAKAGSAIPAAVAANDVANNIADLYGRQLVSHIPPEMHMCKAYNDTSSRAAGSAVVALASTAGKKLAIVGFSISTYGTTAGRIFLYFGNADATYTAGTNWPLFVGSFAPSATTYPGAISNFTVPVMGAADDDVYYENSAALSIDIVFHYYEL